MHRAGDGAAALVAIPALRQANAWTPRPWSRVQPDTGSGDPRGSSAEAGARYLAAAAASLADLLVALSALERGGDVFA